MNQDFTVFQLIKLCKQEEWEEWDITKEELEGEIVTAIEEIHSGSFNFNIILRGELYEVKSLSHKLIVRFVNDRLKRIYKDIQSNRRVIIKQTISLLQETTPSCILRTDIKGFYDNIDSSRLLSKLKDDSILSYHILNLIDKLLSLCDCGIPKGLSISATLSELYMRKFDSPIRQMKGVYYYSRFVDDILIFAIDKTTLDSVKEKAIGLLNGLGLELNASKTQIFDGNKIETPKLEYLGYSFASEMIGKGRSEKIELIVSIADNKVHRFKKRIAKAFVDYTRNNNFRLLVLRIRFLTGNYSVRSKVGGGDLKAGLYYNYNYLNDESVLRELNWFYYKLIYSKKGSLGVKLNPILNAYQKARLCRFSFVFGWKNRTWNSFKWEDIKKIKRCWYE